MKSIPAIIIAGLGGDSGKTTVSCGLMRYFRNRGLKVAPFKKGPDYIDPAWLALAAGNEARNLDTFLMDEEVIKRSFSNASKDADIAIIEGNRGLLDGMDATGTHSTASLAKLLKAPVIIVQTVSKVTRTAAAYIAGCKILDPEINIAGVILNQTSGERQEGILQEAIENEAGVPVLGMIRRQKNTDFLPSRHLGLITTAEYEYAGEACEFAGSLIDKYVDADKILQIAKKAAISIAETIPQIKVESSEVKIAYFNDPAFSFYYRENLEMLENKGAELIPVSSINAEKLPGVHALYIGGGFPETNAELLSVNKKLMEDLKTKVEGGLPVYAECGGMMYLAKTLEYESRVYDMAGIFDIDIKMSKKPAGHGYMIVKADKENPFYEEGTELKGHEFHYSSVKDNGKDKLTALEVIRGTGIGGGRDGLVYKNVFASYFHLHALSHPEWADSIIKKAKEYFHNL